MKMTWKIIFQNVKILKVDNFTNTNFNSIWHFQFPKLELVYIEKMIQTKIPDWFLAQIGHIKSLKCLSLEPNVISSLEMRTELQCLKMVIDNNDTFDYVYNMICYVKVLMPLQNIRVTIFVFNSEIDFFDKIISLNEAKLNAIIEIMVSKSYSIVNDPNKDIYENFNDKFIKYQTNFNRTKTLAKLKMKMTLYARFMKDFQFK